MTADGCRMKTLAAHTGKRGPPEGVGPAVTLSNIVPVLTLGDSGTKNGSSVLPPRGRTPSRPGVVCSLTRAILGYSFCLGPEQSKPGQELSRQGHRDPTVLPGTTWPWAERNSPRRGTGRPPCCPESTWGQGPAGKGLRGPPWGEGRVGERGEGAELLPPARPGQDRRC